MHKRNRRIPNSPETSTVDASLDGHDVTLCNDQADGVERVERIDDGHIIEFGEYWRYAPVESEEGVKTSLTPDNIYILTDVKVNLITDEVQTVVLYQPMHEAKNSYGSSYSFDVKEFLANFKPVPKEEAERLRQLKLTALSKDVERIGSEIQQALSDPQALLQQIAESDNETIREGRDGLHRGVALPSPQMMASRGTSLISDAESMVAIDQQKKQLENQVVLGKLVEVLTTAKSNELSTVLNYTQDLLMENAYAIKGKAKDMNRKVENVMRKVDTMKLYLGDDVEAQVIIEGETLTDHHVPYTLFSQMVFMDEEIATERIFSDGTFDYSKEQDFFEFMRQRPDIVQRILPTERCIVTLRPCRESMNYSRQDLSACEWSRRDKLNKTAFLLVRNGDQVCAIDSPIDYKERLYPTDAEMESFFAGVFATDTNIVDQQRSFANSAEAYRALSAVIQGVKDRQDQGGLDVFGELPMESIGNSFMNDVYVRKNCYFVNDEDNLLGTTGLPEDIHEWFRGFSSFYTHIKGDVLVYERGLLSYEAIPSAYRWHEASCEYITNWEVKYEGERIRQSRVATHKGEPYLLTELSHEYNEKPNKNFRVFLKNIPSEALNIMEIPLSMINKVLLARTLRYTIVQSGYMELLVEARAILMGLFDQGREVLNGLAESYPTYSEDKLQWLYMDWYRSANETAIETKTAKQITTTIVVRQNKSIAFNDTLITKVADTLASQNETPLFASIKDGALYVFTTGNKARGNYAVSFAKVEYSAKARHGMYGSSEKGTLKPQHPFFHGYKVGMKGKLTSMGVIGSEIQAYPVTTKLHDDLDSFGLTSRRLTGKQWGILEYSATSVFAQYVSWIEALGDAERAKNDELTLITMNMFFDVLRTYQPNAKKVKGNVTVAQPFLPVEVGVNYNGTDLALEGFTFSIHRAIAYLFFTLSPAGQLAHRSHTEKTISTILRWSDFVDDMRSMRSADGLGHIMAGETSEPTLDLISTSTTTDRTVVGGRFRLPSSVAAKQVVKLFSTKYDASFVKQLFPYKDFDTM
jgi:hypothetical protein